MKLREIKGSDSNFGDVIKMLIDHFNYSIEGINSYDELTDEEKNLIDRSLFNKYTENSPINDTYRLVVGPDVEYYSRLDGFEKNSYPINDNELNKLGIPAYMINLKWIESL